MKSSRAWHKADVDKWYLSKQSGMPILVLYGGGLIEQACSEGQLAVLKWNFPICPYFGDALRRGTIFAAKRGRISVLKWLNALTGEMAKDEKQMSVAMWAAYEGHSSVLLWLHSLGLLNMLEQDSSGMTVAHWAASCVKESQVLKILFSLDLLDATVTDHRGKTISHTAISTGNVSVLKWMYERGLYTSAKDSDGFTCAHWAAIYGHESVLKWLHSMGLLQVEEKDRIGRNVTLLAERCEAPADLISWLRSLQNSTPHTKMTQNPETN